MITQNLIYADHPSCETIPLDTSFKSAVLQKFLLSKQLGTTHNSRLPKVPILLFMLLIALFQIHSDQSE